MSRGRGAHFSGIAAEEIAERLYRAEGAELVARRWRCPEGEIDLILRSGGWLVFVEVKARRGHGEAAASISPAQWRRIGAAASRYLAEATDGSVPCRFDVVLVDRGGVAERIENAASFDA
ncbi:MAG: YraN family protein [Rhodobacteraceae bacterium]|nr:YraN family protein [Paracoccaceae bacterium]